MKTRAKRLAVTLAILALALALAGGWLLGTASGLRFVVARVQGFTGGAFTVAHTEGRLLGPFVLTNARYADGSGLDVRVARATIRPDLWALLRRQIHLRELDAAGLVVTLPPPAPDGTAAGGFSLQPPVAMRLDAARLAGLRILRGPAALFVADRLELAGAWTASGVTLDRLRLRAPDGHADLDGRLALGERLGGDGTLDFAWRAAGSDYAGALEVHADPPRARLALTLRQPTPLAFQLELAQDAAQAWTAALQAPRFDPRPWLGTGAPASLAADLKGHGAGTAANLEGSLELAGQRLTLAPLRVHLDPDRRTLHLDALTLHAAALAGTLEANGRLDLAATPLAGALTLRWHDVVVPPALAGQTLASAGTLAVEGSTADFQARGQGALGPPGRPVDFDLAVRGGADRLDITALTLRQPQGGRLDLHGRLAFGSVPGWQVQAQAQKLDPGLLFAGWDGALDADLRSQGSLPAAGPDLSVDVARLEGRLRGRVLRGNGRLHLAPDRVLDGQLALASGASRITLTARPGPHNDARLTLAIASLADWLPAAGGRLAGDMRLTGDWPRLTLNGRLDGDNLRLDGNAVRHWQLLANVTDLTHPAGRLTVTADGVALGGLRFRRIELAGDGDPTAHRLRLDARGEQLALRLALNGVLRERRWQGTLGTLDVLPQGLAAWHLQRPATLVWNDGAASLGDLCLGAGTAQLCVQAARDAPGNVDLGYRLHGLPLASVLDATGYADATVRVTGELEGEGRLHRNLAGAWSGQAALASPQGTVSHLDHPDQALLAWHTLALGATLAPDRQQFALHGTLDHDGRIDGRLAITGAARTLDGEATFSLPELSALTVFTDTLAEPRGRLHGRLRVGGTLQSPRPAGEFAVEDFAAELPALGLHLDQGTLAGRFEDAARLAIDGRVRSGEGTLVIDGSLPLADGGTGTLRLEGARITAVDLPAAKVVASPALALRRGADGIVLDGRVRVDSAEVAMDRLPGQGAVKPSPDVVVIDRPAPAAHAAALPFTVRVAVDLSPRVHVTGYGVDGHLQGSLTVIEQPGQPPVGQGQLAVRGTYKAYGQTLTIDAGQLAFAGTPLDDPGLNLRAVRRLNPAATIDEGQQVGLLIQGTARRPVLSVFSDPAMEQSDALAYLVTGKPLSQVKGEEGNNVNAAAQALGSAAGNLLAKRVGAQLGLDEVGVANNEALGGTSAFTVGKYLSPRLYLSYGVGLFEPGEVVTLRYRLNRRWHFEAQSASDYTRASLNYRIER